MNDPNTRLRDGHIEVEFEAMIDMPDGKVRYIEVWASSITAAHSAVLCQLQPGEYNRGINQVVDA